MWLRWLLEVTQRLTESLNRDEVTRVIEHLVKPVELATVREVLSRVRRAPTP